MAAALGFVLIDDVMGGEVAVHALVDGRWPPSSGCEGCGRHGLPSFISASGGGDGAVVVGIQAEPQAACADL
jgi:hypothetical protein